MYAKNSRVALSILTLMTNGLVAVVVGTAVRYALVQYRQRRTAAY